MKKLWRFIKHYFELRYDALRLWLAIKLADAKQAAHNKRYYVLPDAYGRLQVLNAFELKELRKPIRVYKEIDGKKVSRKVYLMNPHATHIDWMRECYYYTRLSLNEQPMDSEERALRKKSWLSLMEAKRFAYKMRK